MLYPDRQTGGTALQIDFIGISAFRLNEERVAVFIGESNNLVFYRWTVARTYSMNHARVHRRFIQISPDQFVGLFGGSGLIAGHLLPDRTLI